MMWSIQRKKDVNRVHVGASVDQKRNPLPHLSLNPSAFLSLYLSLSPHRFFACFLSCCACCNVNEVGSVHTWIKAWAWKTPETWSKSKSRRKEIQRTTSKSTRPLRVWVPAEETAALHEGAEWMNDCSQRSQNDAWGMHGVSYSKKMLSERNTWETELQLFVLPLGGTAFRQISKMVPSKEDKMWITFMKGVQRSIHPSIDQKRNSCLSSLFNPVYFRLPTSFRALFAAAPLVNKSSRFCDQLDHSPLTQIPAT